MLLSMPNMIGRPAFRTMEMNGGSSAPHLAQKGKSAINLSNLGKFAKFDPGLFIYVRPVGGLEDYLC